ncbi:MAG: MBL fold metallo-hydrolase, partial [Phycisphaerae bacterium]|nr:MBL fold metallo-hydrolase [Phycisphaerae bacterium]
QEIMCSLDAVYLESNYDPEMLRNGSYPQELQDRISGPHGHLSNDDAADLLCCASKRLQWVALSHLSQDNNTPELALKTHRKKLGRQFPFFLAPRHHASEIMSL